MRPIWSSRCGTTGNYHHRGDDHARLAERAHGAQGVPRYSATRKATFGPESAAPTWTAPDSSIWLCHWCARINPSPMSGARKLLTALTNRLITDAAGLFSGQPADHTGRPTESTRGGTLVDSPNPAAPDPTTTTSHWLSNLIYRTALVCRGLCPGDPGDSAPGSRSSRRAGVKAAATCGIL
jgi:hypothetical protein